MKHLKLLFFIPFFILQVLHLNAQGIIVNEFSNGTSGDKEFVELLVIGSSTDPNSPVDLAGWIVDDNANNFGNNIGTANGYFTLGSCLNSVPPGVIIVIYNDGDLNNELAGQTEDLIYNDDCTIYIPASSSCITKCSGTDYSVCGPTASTTWNFVALRNAGDVVQVSKPDGTFYHGFAYGDLSSPYPSFPTEFGGGSSFTITGNGLNQNYSFGSGNFTTATNFTRTGASTADSPGDANNDANRYFINAVRDGSYNYSNLSATSNTGTATSLKSCVCIEPVATITSASTLLTCTNTSISLDGSSSTAINTVSYAWSTNETTSSININTPGVYTLTVTNTNGASSCISINSVEITEDKVKPSVTIATPDELTCTTQSIDLTATPTVQGTASYAWSGGPTGITTPGDYTVTVTDSDNGCTSTSSTTVTSNTTVPTATLSNNGPLTCSILEATLTATGGDLYDFGTGSSTTNTLLVTLDDVYTVTVYDSASGCSSISNTSVVDECLFPLDFLTFDLKETNSEIELIWTTANESNISHYNIQRSYDGIYFDNIAAIDAKNAIENSYSYTDIIIKEKTPVYYRIEIIEFDNLVQYSDLVIYNNAHQFSISVYPNPVFESLIVETNAQDFKNLNWRIFDVSGRIVSEGGIANNYIVVEMKKYPSGFYILQIESINDNIKFYKL